MSSFLFGWANGFTIATDYCLINFDPQRSINPRSRTFISHAHCDHIGGLSSNGRIYLTPQTAGIIYSVKGFKNSFIPLELGKSIKIDQFEIVSHNAGHILGSAQYEIRAPSSTLVYTGDINCLNMLTTTAAESIPCEILILETTYGSYPYIFPDLTKTAVKMIEWTIKEIQDGRTPVFKIYSAGKSQEIMRMFNLFTNIPVVTNNVIAAITEIYIKSGTSLRYLNSETEEGIEVLASGEVVYLTSYDHDIIKVKRPSIATATGWAVTKQSTADVTFPLSSHADFRQLVEYVKKAKPNEVLTMHGFKEEFASYIKKKLGIKARPVQYIEQKVLEKYLQL